MPRRKAKSCVAVSEYPRDVFVYKMILQKAQRSCTKSADVEVQSRRQASCRLCHLVVRTHTHSSFVKHRPLYLAVGTEPLPA